MIIRILFAFLFSYAVLKIPKNYAGWTGGFRLDKIQVKTANKPEWEAPLGADLFSQPFFYFKRGSQSYVFLSQDKQHVLKIFAQPTCKRHLWQRVKNGIGPLPFDDRVLDGYALAARLPPEQTGLVFVHLNVTENQLPMVELRDAWGRTLSIPLDRYRFVVQKKTELLIHAMEKAVQAKRKEEIERLVDSYKTCISLRAASGLRNRDTEFKRNFGYLEGRVIEFDFGDFVYDPSSDASTELFIFTDRMLYWMRENAPESLVKNDEIY